MRLLVKRIYDTPQDADGFRVLIDRLWPRGLSKARARVDHWAKNLAPSHELRGWYRHDPERWDEFRRRYFAELDAVPELVSDLRSRLPSGTVTILFGSREPRYNNATALKEYLEDPR